MMKPKALFPVALMLLCIFGGSVRAFCIYNDNDFNIHVRNADQYSCLCISTDPLWYYGTGYNCKCESANSYKTGYGSGDNPNIGRTIKPKEKDVSDDGQGRGV